jgi:uncharacterized protein CbrC (UPF0167 family)
MWNGNIHDTENMCTRSDGLTFGGNLYSELGLKMCEWINADMCAMARVIINVVIIGNA